uniref:F-box domain-containing protein n=1 Tax=Panagrellus redivivus TaxID=6233 RepID=A0A7E4VUE8_PANRE
ALLSWRKQGQRNTKIRDSRDSRLHDLATLPERYNIQIAFGNYHICPPIQTVDTTIKSTRTFFHYMNGCVNVADFDVGKDGLLYCIAELWLFSASSQNVTSAPFERFCGQKLLNLHDCHLSKTLFEKLSRLVTAGSIQQFYLDKNTNDEYVLKMSDLLAVFPNLTKICVVELSFVDTWMTEILEFPLHSLTDLFLNLTLEKFRDLPTDELVAFLQAQKAGFRLTLHVVPINKYVPLELDLPNVPNFTVSANFEYDWVSSGVPQQYYNNTRIIVHCASYHHVYFF